MKWIDVRGKTDPQCGQDIRLLYIDTESNTLCEVITSFDCCKVWAKGQNFPSEIEEKGDDSFIAEDWDSDHKIKKPFIPVAWKPMDEGTEKE